MKYFFQVISFILILTGFNLAIAAEIYQVKGVKVSVTAVNAKKAKQEAVDKAQIEAFRILVSKADLTEEFFVQNKIEILSAAREYQIVNESIAKSSYSGVFDVYFSAAHVTKLLELKGIDSQSLDLDSYVLSKKTKTPNKSEIIIDGDDDATAVYQDAKDFAPQDRKLIIPLFGFEGKVILWGENNLWLEQWTKRADVAGEKGIIVPSGDLDDINDSKFNILLSSYKSFASLLQKYNAASVLIAFAELKKVQGMYKLNVSMKILSGKHEYSYLKQYFEFSGAAGAEMLSEAFYKVLNTKADNQYDLKNLEIQISDNLEVEAIFNPETFADWSTLSRELEKVPTVKKVSLVEFNSQTMLVSIIFNSSLDEFRTNLRKRGYRLIDADGKFVIKKE